MASISTYDEIKELEKKGIIGPEAPPEPEYWCWPILEKDLLPEKFVHDYIAYGEIRWYGEA